jgi:hypothetical protein
MTLRVSTLGSYSTDLTDRISGLNYSNVNPGGDEVCTFELLRSWFAGAPEIAQGTIIRVTDGLDVLWQGRIEENDRRVANAEAIGVTAYGLGVRLKDDGTFMQIYVDRDASKWGDMPFNEYVRLAALDTGSFTWASSEGGLVCAVPNQALSTSAEHSAWYTCPSGLTVGKVMYVGTQSIATPPIAAAQFLSANQDSFSGSAALVTPTLDSTLRTATPASQWRYIAATLSVSAAGTPAVGTNRRYSKIAVYGNHGLTTRAIDASTPDGVYGGDVVNQLATGATGITVAQIDAPTTIIPHLVFDSPGTREEAIRAVNAFFGYDWGTWGPSSVFDSSTNGFFRWTSRDTTSVAWEVSRQDCDDIALNVEMSSLYNSVDVHYTDPAAPGDQIVTRTAVVEALVSAGINRKAVLQGGTMTLAAAQTLGDIALALSGGRPARGSIRLTTPIRHRTRGRLPPHRIRADGSNIKLRDILPAVSLLGLSSAPDRRSTFPIKRVSVDASNQVPTVSVEVDQTFDALSILQARLALAAQFPKGLTPAR